MSKKNLLGLLMLVQVSGVLGCAAVVRESTKGALEAIREQQNETERGEQDSLTRGTAAQVTRGALDVLITGQVPDQEQQPGSAPDKPSAGGGEGTPAAAGGAVASAGTGGSGPAPRGPVPLLAAQLVRGLSAELERQIGEDGTGPLGRSLSAATAQATSTMIQQTRDEIRLFPMCEGLEGARASECKEARMAEVSESIGGGLVRGMFKAAQPVLLIVAFGGGLLVGLLVFLALSVARLRRESGGTGVLQQRRPA